MSNILAVDLGITSFGYAILQEVEKNLYHCIDNAVVMRTSPYDEKSGESSQSTRSSQKSLRNLIQKRKRRIRCVAKVLDAFQIIPYKKSIELNDPKNNPIKDKWRLRAIDAWERPLSSEEL